MRNRVLPLLCAWLIIDLCGMGEGNYCYYQEDGVFHHDILREGTFEASSWNFQKSISTFVSKMMVVLEVKQQTVATKSTCTPSLCCVAIMVVVRSSDFMCLRVVAMSDDVILLKISESTNGNAIILKEQDFHCGCCTMLSLSDGDYVEEAVLLLFGLFHQGWMTTSLLLIPRFNTEDMLSLSSVMVYKYLQLNPPLPQVHTPDRPSREPPAGHQPIWSIEALGDCRCSILVSELSTDDR